MQDIDFDEIDRAVSSASSPRVSRDVSSPAVRRSSGRFMDVVHASSDMRPTAARSQTPMVPNPPRETPVPAASPEQAEPVSPAVDTTETFHWPDPIDLHEKNNPESPAEPVDEPAAEASADTEETPVPLDSPFLSDAKVEKRPAGAFSDPDTTTEPILESEAPQNHEEPTNIPPELHEELLNIDTLVESEPAETEDTPPSESEDIPVGPTSITQQYKEQPSSDSEPSGAIFDTEVYNQALVHTPHKTKKILIVVWIVALILVGGGIGAGVYFVFLPMFS